MDRARIDPPDRFLCRLKLMDAQEAIGILPDLSIGFMDLQLSSESA